MPRLSRVRSETGIYHVMLRGIDKRDIFLNENDYIVFLKYLIKAKEKSNFSLIAYCLMTNHVHLLIKEANEEIGNIIRRITVGYVQYHNLNYDRVGHLFQNRFKSEPVKDEKYLLTVIRYIHQNPMKAGIVKKISNYKWSSYNDYINNNGDLIDMEIPMGYFNDIDSFIEFNNKKTNDQCMDYGARIRYKDNELKEVINKIININTIQLLDTHSRNEALRKIKQETGASNRQLERVLGIGRGIIQRI